MWLAALGFAGPLTKPASGGESSGGEAGGVVGCARKPASHIMSSVALLRQVVGQQSHNVVHLFMSICLVVLLHKWHTRMQRVKGWW